MKKLVIIGAGGHGRVVADIARLLGYKKIYFLDDDVKNFLACGKIEEFLKYIPDSLFFVAVGNNAVRERFFEELKEKGGIIVNLVHPSAVIANDVNLGRGIVVMAGAVINTGSQIGDGCIINTASSVDHDCKIGKFVHISVGAHLAGTVNVGERTFIGAGATVINNINVVSDCIIGAGAVVVKNLGQAGTYIGVPARNKVKNN